MLGGEGDGSLASWRAGHWEYFERSLGRMGKRPTPDMPLGCERFRVLYREEKKGVST